MPVTKSAKKALRQSRRKTQSNKPIRARVKTVVSKVRRAPTVENLKEAYSILDKAAKKKVIKKGRVDRLKSRLAKLLNQTAIEKGASKKSAKKTKRHKKS